jgi:putative SOS response-associated peptidase YedK
VATTDSKPATPTTSVKAEPTTDSKPATPTTSVKAEPTTDSKPATPTASIKAEPTTDSKPATPTTSIKEEPTAETRTTTTSCPKSVSLSNDDDADELEVDACCCSEVVADREIQMMRWGVITSKDCPSGLQTSNARAEGILASPLWSRLIRRGRCVAVVDGYYEWKAQGKSKLPYYITRTGGGLLLLAALYDHTTFSYAVITTESTGAIADIHHRMPGIHPCIHASMQSVVKLRLMLHCLTPVQCAVILETDESVARWLDVTTPESQYMQMLQAHPDAVVWHAVSTSMSLLHTNQQIHDCFCAFANANDRLALFVVVNSVKNNSAACIVPQVTRAIDSFFKPKPKPKPESLSVDAAELRKRTKPSSDDEVANEAKRQRVSSE